MPNVIITPHVAARSPQIEGRRLAVIRDNVRRFVAGEAVTNVVNKPAWVELSSGLWSFGMPDGVFTSGPRRLSTSVSWRNRSASVGFTSSVTGRSF